METSLLETILSPKCLENLRQNGAMIFDVDDTLLARRTKPTEHDQVFSESAAAVSVPLLLNAGLHVGVITGHGWAQLERRFVSPFLEDIRTRFPGNRDEILRSFFIYANRGATKIVWEDGEYREDTSYAGDLLFDKNDSVRLREILEKLKKSFAEDFAKRKDFYLENFPKFAFEELPPGIVERENVVLGLRPIPSEAHAENEFSESPRRKLFLLGSEAIKKAGLDAKYEIAESGKSTLEITNRQVSKKTAVRDLFFQVAAETGLRPETVEESSIYVGDEFGAGGNDLVVLENFPGLLCFSVAAGKQEGAISLPEIFAVEGIAATAALASHILKILTER